MKRREFVGAALAGSVVWGSTAGGSVGQNPILCELSGRAGEEGVPIERPLAGLPHVGKVLAAIQPEAKQDGRLEQEHPINEGARSSWGAGCRDKNTSGTEPRVKYFS